MLSPESSIAFFIGKFPVHYYSITMFLAILLGTVFSCFVAKKYYKEVNIDVILDVLPIVIIAGILGARLYYVLLDWSYYSQNLCDIWAIYKGGLSIHGAILGGFLGGFVYIKKNRLNLWKIADVYSYGLILGQIIGRLGNYFNKEAFGLPCYFMNNICLYIPEKHRPIQFLYVEFFHPTFLYEMVWNIFVLMILLFCVRRVVKNVDGVVFFSYLFLYSLGRVFIEALRLDSVLTINGIHFAQVVSVLVCLVSGVIVFNLLRKNYSKLK